MILVSVKKALGKPKSAVERATALGWDHTDVPAYDNHGKEYQCNHGGTDGGADCDECGTSRATFEGHAEDWLKEHGHEGEER